MDEKIEIRVEKNHLYLCPIWWRNYVLSQNVCGEELRTQVYNDWKIIVGTLSPLIIIFPSVDVYVQFLLTYS